MLAYLVLVFAIFSRLVPHLLHTPAWGVTALGGGMLFFGSRLQSRQRWQALAAIPLLAATDWYLTTRVYGFPFHLRSYVIPWLWYAAVAVLGAALLHRRRSVVRVGGAALLSATGFFILSNGLVWIGGEMYPRSFGGLLACYAAGLPFYRNDALSTLALCGILFGLPALARELAHRLELLRGSRFIA